MSGGAEAPQDEMGLAFADSFVGRAAMGGSATWSSPLHSAVAERVTAPMDSASAIAPDLREQGRQRRVVTLINCQGGCNASCPCKLLDG